MKKVLVMFIGLTLLILPSGAIAQDAATDEFESGGIDIVLKIEGIDGESKVTGHENDIDVLAWSWGMDQSGSMHIGGGGGAGMVNVKDVSLTKYVDKASAALMVACLSGEHLTEATLTVRKSGIPSVDMLVITMSPVLVTSVSAGSSVSNYGVTETVTLNFARFMVRYTPQKEDGSADASIDFTWNIEKNIQE